VATDLRKAINGIRSIDLSEHRTWKPAIVSPSTIVATASYHYSHFDTFIMLPRNIVFSPSVGETPIPWDRRVIRCSLGTGTSLKIMSELPSVGAMVATELQYQRHPQRQCELFPARARRPL